MNGAPGATVIQIAKVAIAMEITTGTKMELTRSASRWIGAFEPCASCMRRTMRASTLFAPTVVASKRKEPVVFIVPPITAMPVVFSTGIDSPVTMDSSTALAPAVMRPSTGMRSPGRTITTSPARTSAIGMSCSSSDRTTRAVRGCSRTSARRARVVSPVARASSMLPTSTSAMMMSTAS